MNTKLLRRPLLALALVGSLALCAQAQTLPTGTNALSGDNLPKGTNAITGGLNLMDQVTNIAFVGFGTYVKDSKKVGGGIMAIYNVTANLGTGVGLEVVGKDAEVVSGNVELKLETHPLKFLGWDSFAAIPWAGAFLGTPVGGAGSNNGGLAAGGGGGCYFNILDVGKGWTLCGGAGATKWSGAGKDFNGLHILGFLSLNHGI